MKGSRVGRQHRRHTGHRQPHQHLVTRHQPQCRRQPALQPALGGGRDDGQIARAGDEQQDDECDDKCAVVDDAKHGDFFLVCLEVEGEFTLRFGRAIWRPLGDALVITRSAPGANAAAHVPRPSGSSLTSLWHSPQALCLRLIRLFVSCVPPASPDLPIKPGNPGSSTEA